MHSSVDLEKRLEGLPGLAGPFLCLLDLRIPLLLDHLSPYTLQRYPLVRFLRPQRKHNDKPRELEMRSTRPLRSQREAGDNSPDVRYFHNS